ncbi:MAG: hypothetical protein NTW60_02360 [Candidatus Wolfebacteria bacterium]|nr:hypothetical protein [Candidatus Wolfebacteria bacterium]
MDEKYLEILKERGTQSKVYKEYQLTGLMISEILRDEKHKALYIKLAKERNQSKLLGLAKGIAERPGIKNKGAYFMRMVQVLNQEKKKKIEKDG